ncbi:hypothetical protein, partial [Halovulum sp. GXIMD14793]
MEKGGDARVTLPAIKATFIKRLGELSTAEEPEAEALHEAVNQTAQSLVAHLSHHPDLQTAVADAVDLRGLAEEMSEQSNGAGWVLQMLNISSAELIVLEVETQRGVRMSYRNIANCFHLFTLLQTAWAQQFNAPRAPSLKSESVGFPRCGFCDSLYLEVEHGQIAITGYSGA